MPRPITIAATTFAAVFLAGAVMHVAVSAQAGPRSAPSTENQGTVPIKVTTRDYDTKKLLSAPALSEEAHAGVALWQQRCAFCHDGMGQPSYKTMGPWIDSDTVKEMGADTLKAIISSGSVRMPAFKYDLDAKQINDVIEFLKTVSPTLKPTAAQLAGKSEADNGSD